MDGCFSFNTVEIYGVPFSCCEFEDILFSMDETIKKNKRGYISITNTESLYHAMKIPSHCEYIKKSKFSCCDGVGVVIAGKMFGYNIPRLHGPDLMLKCCGYGIDKGWKHYFYGGKEGVPELLGKKLSEKFPGLITAGTYSPPFRQLTPAEDKAIIEQINEARPDILWVGLGLLKQEKWIAEHLCNIKVPWMIGVGAAFDFHAGTIKRAPKFFRDIGLEWLYRVTFEPRMIRRNLLSFKLLLLVAWKALGDRILSNPSSPFR